MDHHVWLDAKIAEAAKAAEAAEAEAAEAEAAEPVELFLNHLSVKGYVFIILLTILH